MSILLGSSPTGPVELGIETFLRHMVCLGSSGSGKTVACKVLCEEFVRAGVPVIAVDPQGDIASLAIPASIEKIAEKGLPASLLEEYTRRAEVVVWTPASSTGIPLSVNPLECLERCVTKGEDRIRGISALSQNLAGILGYDLGSDDGRAVSGYLHLVLDHALAAGLVMRRFDRLASFLSEPPDGLAHECEKVLEPRKQDKVRRQIQLLSVGAHQLLFQLGVPLDIDVLLGRDPGSDPAKTRVSVIYLNSLANQAEKEFLLAQLAQSLYDWMLSHPATTPQALFYVDEVSPYLPPVRKPACKDALQLLFKQARKYGVSCLLASQNPGDIDYKSLAQFSTWNLGRMMVQQDIKKVAKTIQSIAGGATDRILGSLPSLAPGQFVLLSPDAFPDPVDLRVRWLLTEHRTLDEEAIGETVDAAIRRRLMDRAAADRMAREESERDQERAAPAARDERESIAESDQTTETAPADLAEVPADELASDQEAPPVEASFGETLAARMLEAKRVFSVKDLAVDLGATEAAVRRTLLALEAQKKIAKEKSGRAYVYWSSAYKFYPEHGIDKAVLVARRKVSERDALVAAEGATSGLLGLLKKDLGPAAFLHHPVWQIRLTVTVSKGFLFWKEVKRRFENLYFHARTGDLVVARADGLAFVSVVKEDPADIRDLDDVCEFDEQTPGEFGLDRRTLRGILPEKSVVEKAERKFPIRAEECRLVFLPVFRFAIGGENRAIEIDGILGKRLEY